MSEALKARVDAALPDGYRTVYVPVEDEVTDEEYAVVYAGSGRETGVSVQVGANYLIVNKWVDDGEAMRHWPTRSWDYRGARHGFWGLLGNDLAEALIWR